MRISCSGSSQRRVTTSAFGASASRCREGGLLRRLAVEARDVADEQLPDALEMLIGLLGVEVGRQHLDAPEPLPSTNSNFASSSSPSTRVFTKAQCSRSLCS